MGLFHIAYNGYVGKTTPPYRHPERSRGIFLAHRYSAVCVIVEKGKTFAKEARKRGVQGRFLDFARNDCMGEWVYFTWRTTDMFGKRYSSQCHPERSRGIFLAHWYSVLCETAEKGKPSAKGARKNKVQGRFLAALEMTVSGDRKVQET